MPDFAHFTQSPTLGRKSCATSPTASCTRKSNTPVLGDTRGLVVWFLTKVKQKNSRQSRIFRIGHFSLSHLRTRLRTPLSTPASGTAAASWILGLEHTPSDAATSVVLPRHAVASPHWVCMEAAITSPQPLWEQLGRCKCSPMQTQWGDATAQWGSTTQRSVCPHPDSSGVVQISAHAHILSRHMPF